MSDIMMCDAADCTKSVNCYRHKDSGTTPHPYYQTYWLRDGASPTGDVCEQFWQVNVMVKLAHDGSLP